MNARIRVRLVSVLILLTGLSVGSGCATDAQVISQAANTHKSLSPAVIEDATLAKYIQDVGDRVVDAAKERDAQGVGPKSHKSGDNAWMFSTKMKFHFVNSKTLNAFTTGGEHMYIYTELFRQCKTEDELAAVVAHEFAHVYCRHVAKGMDRQIPLLVGGAAVGGAAGYALGGDDNKWEGAALGAGVGVAGSQFVGMGFTRGDEAEADKYGFDFYTHAGWDPDHFGDFFQTMIDKGYDKTPGFLSDHPTLASRVQESKGRAKDLPENAKSWRRSPVASPSKFKQMQDRATSVGKSMPDDSTLAGSQQLLQALPRSCVTPLDAHLKDQQDAQKRLAAAAEARSKKKAK